MKNIRRGLLACTLAGLVTPALAQSLPREYSLEIDALPLVAALKEFSRQTGLQVGYLPNGREDEGTIAAPLRGKYTAESALRELLAPSGLSFERINSRTIAVTTPEVAIFPSYGHPSMPMENAGGQFAPKFLRLIDRRFNAQPSNHAKVQQVAALQQTGIPDTDRRSSRSDPARETEKLEEVIVTGSSIRGAAPVGSPMLILDRAEIDRSGFGTAQQLIESLPQNFRGSATADSLQVRGGVNFSRAAGVNLRGLGESSTLVLVNGRRLALGGGFAGSFVDISTLPLTAVERVEILTDGASAIYGSDAIAGVINFILRDSYDGSVTRLRGGGVTQGGLREIQASQTLGKVWKDGNGLLSYEYHGRDSMDSAERRFAASSDLRPYGGSQFGSTASNPGNITSPRAAGIPPDQDGTSVLPEDLLGTTNLHNFRKGVDLFPKESRHSLFLTAEQHLTSDIAAFADLRFSRREYESRIGGQAMSSITVPNTNPFFVTPTPGATSIRVNYNFLDDFGPQTNVGDVTSLGGTGGVRLTLPRGWQAELYGTYDREDVDRSVNAVNLPNLREALGFDDPATPFDPAVDGYFNIFADGSNTTRDVLDYVGNGFTRVLLDSELWSAHLKADGPVFELPGGTVKIAVGGEYREESLDRTDSALEGSQEVPIDTLGVALSREIDAAFGEISIPLVGANNSVSGIDRLDVSIAYRFESYSDFGSTTNPKFGVLWSPARGLAFRGSYGTSFRAPNFHDLAPILQFYRTGDLPTPSGGRTHALVLQGNNPDLGPETSTSWTAGVDLWPTLAPMLSVQLTYFDIEFENRIGTLGSVINTFLQPDLFGPITTLNPDPAVVQAYLDSQYYLPTGPIPPASDVQAIVDARSRNLATTDVSGLDITASYGIDSDLGSFSFRINGNYLFKFEEAVTTTAPVFDVVDTLSNPAALRLRGSVSWVRDQWSATAFTNYLDSYADNVSIPNRKVGSWTTFDLNVAYDTGARPESQWLQGVRLSASIQNLFDRDPPFANNAGLGYDPKNASPLGRFVSFQVSKQW